MYLLFEVGLWILCQIPGVPITYYLKLVIREMYEVSVI